MFVGALLVALLLEIIDAKVSCVLTLAGNSIGVSATGRSVFVGRMSVSVSVAIVVGTSPVSVGTISGTTAE